MALRVPGLSHAQCGVRPHRELGLDTVMPSVKNRRENRILLRCPYRALLVRHGHDVREESTGESNPVESDKSAL
eukprot:422452-Pyramimonas_sp.AAC.2